MSGCIKAVCFYMVFVMNWLVDSLPGFTAPLPFKLETGYTEVDDLEFFYYFIESERSPAEDPLLLWLTGGPGCSSLSGFFLEIGDLIGYIHFVKESCLNYKLISSL
ncbi:serine carboxypeptidase-like 2 [Gossypium australe]|uniref:Serine carboxypeptidase-like 2 n=1 Tax=Gossypium australe TaxID=47621 RepID=A0A5B6UUN8_9ROSI|nr:serine carboxypeptidase-like 2 [Gossypium australe]